MAKRENVSGKNATEKKKIYRKDIDKGYIILYLGVFLLVVIGEVILFQFENFTISDLFKDILGNLMGVLGAFLVFDIAHEKISKDSYASEVSEQILDTLMYHQEALDMYDSEQKKIFVKTFIGSIVDDEDISDMISSHLDNYVLTHKDFEEKSNVFTERDCRLRTSFDYDFILETERTGSFAALQAMNEDNTDPYFYMQQKLNFQVKYLSQHGNFTQSEKVKIAFVYDNATLDDSLRSNECVFRENLELEDVDKAYFASMKDNKTALKEAVKKMFRPHLSVDKFRGEVQEVEVVEDRGMIITFEVKGMDYTANTHEIDILFHMPKKWDSIIEVAIVEPTKAPKISLSYNEDKMDVDMYPFLNRGDSSAHSLVSERENGLFHLSLNGEWVYPVSGVIFSVKKNSKINL
nr:hypothetical protein [Lachnospiraceae bacterium]